MLILSSPLALIQSVPIVTRLFTAATILFTFLYAYCSWKGLGAEAAQYMTLMPGYALYSPWTLFTSALVETSIWEAVATLLFVPATLKYLERLWGAIETLKFIVVSITLSNLIALVFNWIEFAATRNADLFLYGMRYHGQMSLQIALLVALTQLIPEHTVQFLGVIKMKMKTLPMLYLTLSTVLCFVGLQCPWIVIQFGWFVSWIYLRFYKKNTSEGLGGGDTYGDRSETFALISWFPPLLHTPLTILGNFVYSWANRLHLIPSQTDAELGVYAPVATNPRAEAERRRALALKALDQRLANNSSPVGSFSGNPGSQNRAAAGGPPAASPPSNGRPLERSKSAGEPEEAKP